MPKNKSIFDWQGSSATSITPLNTETSLLYYQSESWRTKHQGWCPTEMQVSECVVEITAIRAFLKTACLLTLDNTLIT